jgi:DNA polymerase-3 subunit gamma/tau
VSGSSASPPSTASPPGREYVVIARRYRPQTFEDLIGQQHVGQAISNAISTGRVGHAYLFTGARGVGKTSAARIFAKALNCENGPAPVPCNLCDSCLSVGAGEDVDVLEIDGASNRGIDEIRQLRQNVNVRPSRSRFKVYIIDEVHMLTTPAFNALLKTLEEPPEHVKFIFCTTEPTKIPITILSRCQRFDFAGILTRSIAKRLGQIVEAEGVEAEPEALEALARRAAGSMRDSQSLLEQLLAFSSGPITLGDVHGMLGSAGDERLTALLCHLAAGEAAEAVAELDQALSEGVDVAVLLEQLLGYFRDAMLAAADCPTDAFLYASPASQQQVAESGKRLGLATVLAAMQILEQALARMRYSTQGRILAELALVRISQLEELDELGPLLAELRGAGGTAGPRAPSPAAAAPAVSRPPLRPSAPRTPPAAQKKSPAVAEPAATGDEGTTAPEGPKLPLSPESAPEVWALALEAMSGMVVEQAKQFDHVALASPDRLVVTFKPRDNLAKTSCERPEHLGRFEEAVAEVTGQRVRVEFTLDESAEGVGVSPSAPARRSPLQQRLLEVVDHPMVRRAAELFGAQPTRVDDPPN